MDTGGRFTERTNDLSLGLERAKADRACIYSIGFRDRDLKEDRLQSVSIRVRRDGLHVIHPAAYLFRSATVKRESLVRAAYFSPETFQNGLVRARIFPIRPSGRTAWKGLLAVSFPVPVGGADGQPVLRDVGGVLSLDSKPVHRFSRGIRLEPKHGSVTSQPVVTFLEPVDLVPGKYSLVTVVQEGASVSPLTARVDLEVPGVPEGDAFLVGPILGTRAGKDLVVRGDQAALGDWNSFVPLMVPRVEEPTDLVALTLACVAARVEAPPRSALRSLSTGEGQAVGSLSPVRVEPEGDGEIRCQTLLDVLPSGSLRGSDEYVFDASFAPDLTPTSSRREARFSVGKPRERSTPPAAVAERN